MFSFFKRKPIPVPAPAPVRTVYSGEKYSAERLAELARWKRERAELEAMIKRKSIERGTSTGSSLSAYSVPMAMTTFCSDTSSVDCGSSSD